MKRSETDPNRAVPGAPRAAGHPEMAELLAFHGGALPQEVADVVEEHLSRCPECARQLLDYVRFEQDEPPPGEEETAARRRERDWGALLLRIEQDGES